MLSLKNITRTYRQGDRALNVLNQLNLEIKRGEVVALIGPSGSGKSTLLHIAGLLDRPTSGEVSINPLPPGEGRVRGCQQECGESLTPTLSRRERGDSDASRTLLRRTHIGFVYQMHHLLPEFSALENVMLPQMMAGVGKTAASRKAAALLGELGLSERFRHRPARLSGGEQQRVAIARALANDPVLLLADEPTGNLDPATAEGVFSMLLRLAKEKNLAALVATHNLDLAGRMDRAVRLENGALV